MWRAASGAVRVDTPAVPVVRLTRVSDVHKSQSPLDLAQIFEPVRDDLARVDQEFLKHVQSRVQLIPQIGKYLQTSGGKRIRPATLLMAARMAGYDGDGDTRRAVRLGGGVHPHRDAGARRHHRRIGDAPRPRRRALALGHRHHGAARRLPVHQVDGPGADAGLARHRPPAVRRHAADDRRRALSAHQDRRRRHHRRRALRHHPPQDRAPVRRLRADRRHARRDHAGAAGRRCGSTASTSASPSSWSTICSTTRPTSARSASRSAATCAKAR